MGIVDVLLFSYVALTLSMAIPLPACPDKCECQPDAIACTGLTSFPEKWPSSITRITISQSAFNEIPPGAFANLEDLSRIMITQSNISHIRQCSFSRLSHVLISIDQCIIDTIDSYAFSYLSNTKLSFGASSMRVLSPYAFTRSQKAESWDFIGVNVTSAEPRAFHNLSEIGTLNFMTSTFHEVKSLSMSMLNGVETVMVADNRIDLLYCRTFTEVVGTGGYFGFYGNALYCDCRLEWLFTSGILTAQGRLENRCHGPQSMIDRGYGSSIGNLTEKDLPCLSDDIRGSACPEMDIPEDPVPLCYFDNEIISTTPLPSIQTAGEETSNRISEQTLPLTTAKTTPSTPLSSADKTSEMPSTISSTTEVVKTNAGLTTSPLPTLSSITLATKRKTSTDGPKTSDFIRTTVQGTTKTPAEPTSKLGRRDTTAGQPRTRTSSMTTESTIFLRTRTSSQTDESVRTGDQSQTNAIPNYPMHDDETNNSDNQSGSIVGNDHHIAGGLFETSSAPTAPVIVDSRITAAKTDKQGGTTKPVGSTSQSQRTAVASVFVIVLALMLSSI